MTDKLTPKQEAFCRKYIELSNASEAYRASYEAKGMKDKTIWEAASRLLADSKVAARIKEIQAKHQKRHEVTVDSITEELETARLAALHFGQSSASVAASLGKAKLHGLLVEKHEHSGGEKPVAFTIRIGDAGNRDD